MLAHMKRPWMIALLTLGLIGLLSIVGLSLWLGALIKAGVERLGPHVTKTTISLEAVDVSLLSGCATVKGLVIGNPSGYRAPHAMRVGRAQICVDRASVFTTPLIVTTISLERPEITFEGMVGNSNIGTLRENIKRFTASGKPEAAPSGSGAGKKMLIQDLRVTNGQVALFLKTGLLGDRNLTMGLPDVHLRDIGKETGGATPEELAAAILTALLNAIKQAVTG